MGQLSLVVLLMADHGERQGQNNYKRTREPSVVGHVVGVGDGPAW